jgi:hypothetical protein
VTNHYKILSVPNYSSWAVVRKAYITQIKKYHPDVNKTQEAILICKQLNMAKEALESRDKKASYDSRLKYHLAYGQSSLQSTATAKPRSRRRYSSPPMTRAERVRRNKEHRDKIKLAEYAKGLKSVTLQTRYLMCAIYGAFGLFIMMFTVVNIEDLKLSILIGFVASCFWFHAITLYINEYYKYQDYIARSEPLDFDLDKRSSSRLYAIYLAGFAFAVLMKFMLGNVI